MSAEIYIPAKAKALPNEGASALVQWSQSTGPQLLPANRLNQMRHKRSARRGQNLHRPKGSSFCSQHYTKKQYAREGRLWVWALGRVQGTSQKAHSACRLQETAVRSDSTSRNSKVRISRSGLNTYPNTLVHKPTCT